MICAKQAGQAVLAEGEVRLPDRLETEDPPMLNRSRRRGRHKAQKNA